MYLLYLDESGTHGGNHFILAGIAVFERQTYWLAKELDRIQQQWLPDITEPIEFHASKIRAAKEEPWKRLSDEQRRQLLDEVYRVIVESKSVLFGIAVERQWCKAKGEDEYQFAFESLIVRFDGYLKRLYKEANEPQRGLVVIAQSEFQRRLESLARKIRKEGTRWGEVYNLAEVPLFTLAGNSRLLQVADFCANAIYGRYEGGHARQFDRLVQKFDVAESILRGLAHFSTNYQDCYCPACLSRRLRGENE